MPTYQYRCTECGHDLEAVQRFSDPSLTECPACHGRLRKVFNAVGVVFKGSGFYRTDSRSPESGSSEGAKTSGESKDGGAGGGKKDATSGSSSSDKPGTPAATSGADSTGGSGASTGGAKAPAKASAGSSTGGSSAG